MELPVLKQLFLPCTQLITFNFNLLSDVIIGFRCGGTNWHHAAAMALWAAVVGRGGGGLKGRGFVDLFEFARRQQMEAEASLAARMRPGRWTSSQVRGTSWGGANSSAGRFWQPERNLLLASAYVCSAATKRFTRPCFS